MRTETEQSAPPPAIPTKSDEQPPQLIPADDDSVASDDSSTFGVIEPDDELVIEGMEVSHPSQSAKHVAAPVVSQDDSDAPAYRTRSRHDRLFSALEVSGCRLTPQQAARRTFPASFVANYANAVLDQNTVQVSYSNIGSWSGAHNTRTIGTSHSATKLGD